MDLYSAIIGLGSAEECKVFFNDLCSPAELSAMEHRWTVAKLLSQGRTYQEIIEETKLSSAIVSRVNRVLRDGNGSLREVIDGSLPSSDPQ
jgi:TrpR-related protein YerC/YecD